MWTVDDSSRILAAVIYTALLTPFIVCRLPYKSRLHKYIVKNDKRELTKTCYHSNPQIILNSIHGNLVLACAVATIHGITSHFQLQRQSIMTTLHDRNATTHCLWPKKQRKQNQRNTIYLSTNFGLKMLPSYLQEPR